MIKLPYIVNEEEVYKQIDMGLKQMQTILSEITLFRIDAIAPHDLIQDHSLVFSGSFVYSVPMKIEDLEDMIIQKEGVTIKITSN